MVYNAASRRMVRMLSRAGLGEKKPCGLAGEGIL